MQRFWGRQERAEGADILFAVKRWRLKQGHSTSHFSLIRQGCSLSDIARAQRRAKQQPNSSQTSCSKKWEDGSNECRLLVCHVVLSLLDTSPVSSFNLKCIKWSALLMFAVSAALPAVLRPICLELDTCCIWPHVTSSAPHFYFSFFHFCLPKTWQDLYEKHIFLPKL